MKRREFIIRIGGAVLAAPVVANLVACGDDGGGDGNTPDAAQGGVVDCRTFTIGPPADGHNSPATITAADINAGIDKTYDLTGGGAHSHTFTITAAQFAMLAAGQQVVVTSSNVLNHEHDVTIGGCTS